MNTLWWMSTAIIVGLLVHNVLERNWSLAAFDFVLILGLAHQAWRDRE